MKSRPLLSVVIPTYKDAQCLELTLGSLTRQTLSRDLFEVVVVRDGPGDGYDALPDFGKSLDLQVAMLPERRGRSAARNAGLALATGDTIMFLDSDCYADPGLLSRHHGFHHGDASARVLLGHRYEIDWPHLSLLIQDEPIPADLLTSMEYRDLKFLGADDAGIEECLQTPWLFAHTNNASVPTAVIAAVGGFNEDFGTRWGWEDLELFYRVYQHLGRDDGSFVYDQEAVCYHLPRYRDAMQDYMEFFENESMVKRMHPHLDWEFHTLRMPVTVAAKVRHYRDVIRHCVRTGAGEVGPVESWVGQRLGNHGSPNVLWIGTGVVGRLANGATLTFDYRAPVTQTNRHLIGTVIPATDSAFDAVVSVDFWRCMQWSDLCDFVREATRVAPVVVLIGTATAQLPRQILSTPEELSYLTRALSSHYDLAVDTDGGDLTGITLRRLTTPAAAQA